MKTALSEKKRSHDLSTDVGLTAEGILCNAKP